MAKTCADCIYLDWNNKQTSSVDRRRCTECGIYIEPTSVTCRHFKERVNPTNSGCFITTAVVDILGYKDDCYILQTLRNFRNDFLQKNPEFKNILLTYDKIGPQISVNLFHSDEKERISLIITECYLIPICKLIKDGEYNSAINSYISMVKFLQNQVCVNDYIEGYRYNSSVRNEEMGHGRALVVPING